MQRLHRRQGEHTKPEQLLKHYRKTTYVLVSVTTSVVQQNKTKCDCHITRCTSWLVLPRMIVLIDCVGHYCPFSKNHSEAAVFGQNVKVFVYSVSRVDPDESILF